MNTKQSNDYELNKIGRLVMKKQYLYSAISMSLLTLIAMSATHSNDFNSITEHCAMASMGYQLSSHANLSYDDKYALPEPFYSKPLDNYRLSQAPQKVGTCQIYVAKI